ncbi:MAG: hypothetical protein HEP71_16965 [Roseivirga sp.]|nr:hypothetical protein [Roseivirga sp.]
MLVKEDILTFLRKGKLGNIPFGMELDDLVSHLGPSECIMPLSKQDKTPVSVQYDRMEFHFSSEEPQLLRGIQVISSPGCEAFMLKLDYAGIDRNARYKEVIAVLEANDIPFRESYSSSDLSSQVIVTESGISFFFSESGLIERYGRFLQGL